MCSYNGRLLELKREKEGFKKLQRLTNETLNNQHDLILTETFGAVYEEFIKEHGKPPCDFAWFVTGSAGRKEQGVISDQDHGMIFQKDAPFVQEYFLALGKMVSDALNTVGYPYCEGNVMSSNPIWCKSFAEWQEQLNKWMEMENWESIRYLQIFYDSRELIGNKEFVNELRSVIHAYREQHPALLVRFLNNVMRIKKGVGIFGQFFVERTGVHRGSLHMKNTLYLPYVNSIRLLAIKEGVIATSTLGRMADLKKIGVYEPLMVEYERYFRRILTYRTASFQDDKDYSDVHFLNINRLTKEERTEVKHLLRKGIKLYQQVKRLIEKG
ncbi:DUF294 nucleotidyltransferase-like domain-containing protein [Niallia sp. BSM11]|uniref:DUF294 nucleotidyltransferase-like domain-containing protein n=1 Tax=Niallia sp. BSM11 TaxID=3391576 RepID=UPI00398552BE